ncbi:hypothetical protein FAEPRAA2165_01051 [Faecalibacterium duncaniae]|uniref:Uncharacterized protein n=1 Tax=Faecalibacterium duncaniae (strain DSM 17677 / JCM 31915 / A2-165) TaxID=411483 RepID=C7H437_FAED2|nr:hypothetical protein FAEPRAA2165_01051 [Faecalibacterium duncaniae]
MFKMRFLFSSRASGGSVIVQNLPLSYHKYFKIVSYQADKKCKSFMKCAKGAKIHGLSVQLSQKCAGVSGSFRKFARNCLFCRPKII